MSRPLNRLGASEVAAGVASGDFSALEVVDACLARAAARDDIVGAWEFLDPALARRQARAVDRGRRDGPLAGVPVGVKDVIDTRDMPTAMGSPIHAGRRPGRDAACVAALRAAGAVILGKTVTCEFAGLTPGRTANPLDPARTPGGSSSGSAAAVADCMAPAALGTQTGGSVLRPSSYCGIVGWKPSFGAWSLDGVRPAARSLDTLGLHVRALEDVALFSRALAAGPLPVVSPAPRPPRIGLCRTWWWDEAAPETREAVDGAARRLEAAGAELSDLELPDGFRELAAAREAINARERADAMAPEWERDRERISPGLRETIRQGLALAPGEYAGALALAESCRVAADAVFAGRDAILAPVVDGEAPLGLDDTGSPRFQALWTLLRLPAVSLPLHAGPGGMPVGVQLVAPRGRDGRLIALAGWAMEAA